MQSALHSRVVKTAAYTGQIGAAMTAAAHGLPNSLIKTLGQ